MKKIIYIAVLMIIFSCSYICICNAANNLFSDSEIFRLYLINQHDVLNKTTAEVKDILIELDVASNFEKAKNINYESLNYGINASSIKKYSAISATKLLKEKSSKIEILIFHEKDDVIDISVKFLTRHLKQ